MRAILLTLLTLLLTSCISAPREREAHCLAATMTDVWQAQDELTLAEQVWRSAQEARSQRSSPGPSAVPVRVVGRETISIVEQAAARLESLRSLSSRSDEDATFYQRVVVARARHREASKWFGLVARRVQTRIEEDEMLYPVLGMLATSTAIVLYPLVRWNVRSVLWDGIDPDSENDPVQRFCSARLGQEDRTVR